MRLSCLNLDAFSAKSYSEFVGSAKGVTPFHTNAAVSLLAKELAAKIRIWVVTDGLETLAVMPVLIRAHGLFRESLPHGAYGGFVTAPERHDEVHSYLSREFRPLIPVRIVDYSGLNLSNRHWRRRNASAWIVAIKDGFDGFWAAIGSKTRNQIRKAYREGVVVRRWRDDSDVGSVVRLYTELVRHHGILRPYSPDLFSNILESASQSEDIVPLLAEQDGRVIGAAVFLAGFDELFYWLGFLDRERASANPQYALLDTAARTLTSTRNVGTLNLGAVPSDGASLIKFKRNWGAQERSYSIYWGWL